MAIHRKKIIDQVQVAGRGANIPTPMYNEEINNLRRDSILDDSPAWAGYHPFWQNHPNPRGLESPNHTSDTLMFGEEGIPHRIGWTFNSHLDPTTFFGSIMGETQFGISCGGSEVLVIPRPIIYWRAAGKATIIQAMPQSIQQGISPPIPRMTVPRGLYG